MLAGGYAQRGDRGRASEQQHRVAPSVGQMLTLRHLEVRGRHRERGRRVPDGNERRLSRSEAAAEPPKCTALAGCGARAP